MMIRCAGQCGIVENRLIGEIVDPVQAGDWRCRWRRTCGDDKPARLDAVAACLNGVSVDELRRIADDGHAEAFKPFLAVMRRDGGNDIFHVSHGLAKSTFGFCAATPNSSPEVNAWACLAAASRALEGTQP